MSKMLFHNGPWFYGAYRSPLGAGFFGRFHVVVVAMVEMREQGTCEDDVNLFALDLFNSLDATRNVIPRDAWMSWRYGVRVATYDAAQRAACVAQENVLRHA